MSNSCKDLGKIRAVILHSKDLSPLDINTQQSQGAEVVRQAHHDEQVVGL